MNVVDFLLAWPNVPFTVATLVGLLFFAVQQTGVLVHHDDAHDAHDADDGARLPTSLAVIALSMVFGATGLALHALAGPTWRSLAWSLPVAAIAGAGAVAILRHLLAPLFANKENATTRAELVGKSAIVTSTRVGPDFGEVRVLDKSGHELFVTCRLLQGSDASAASHGADVVIVDCEGDELVVAPLEEREKA